MSGRSDKQTNNVQVPSGNVAPIALEALSDILIAGATAITDIDNVINELQAARDYLEDEAERVCRANARYAHLAKTASASAKTITESMGKNTERPARSTTIASPSTTQDRAGKAATARTIFGKRTVKS